MRSPSILVFDDFYPDPAIKRESALDDDLQEHPELHKGRRGPAQQIPALMQEFFEDSLKATFVDGYCCYQLCVAGDQLVYHSDQQSHAAVVFLTPGAPPDTGTSFFRSKETGIRWAPTLEMAQERRMSPAELEQRTYGGKLLDRTAWQEVDRVGNVYNRLAIWNAKLIHGATEYFGSTPQDGRLFEMFFFDMR